MSFYHNPKSTPSFEKNFWKKQASEALDDRDVELAFMRQAEVHINNKARPFFTNNCALGFEIVDKNDSNTKMVGIFAFRIGKNLFYVPVFFINGEVKGNELLYNAKDKMFTPLDEDWAEFMLGLYLDTPTGRPSDKKRRERTPKDVDFRDIIYPPFTRKMASHAFAEMQEVAKGNAESSKDLLFSFIRDSGTSSIKKIASAASSDINFAEALTGIYENDEWILSDVFAAERAEFKKVAAANAPQTKIALHLGAFNTNNKNVKVASQLKRGFSIEDNRGDDEIGEVIILPEEQVFETASENGVYEIVFADGSLRQGIVLTGDQNKCFNSIGGDSISSHSYDYTTHMTDSLPHRMASGAADYYQRQQVVFIGKDKSILIHESDHQPDVVPVGSRILDEGIESYDVKGPKSGGNYIIYSKDHGIILGPLHVVSKVEESGETILETNRCPDGEFVQYKYKYDPDCKTSKPDMGVIGGDCLFFEVGTIEKESDCCSPPETIKSFKPTGMKFGTLDDVVKSVCGDDYKMGEVRFEENNNIVQIKAANQWTPRMNYIGGLVTAMDSFGLREEDAEALIKKAADNYYHKVKFMTKRSASGVTMEEPQPWFTGYDGDLGVEYQIPESHVIRGISNVIPVPSSRLGDEYQMEGLKDSAVNRNSEEEEEKEAFMETASAEEMAQLAEKTGDKSFFDHGVVGSLVSSYDSSRMIDKWMPDLRQGLDKISRTLFLFYWKPEDFVEDFGVDDQSEIENIMLDALHSYGKLVLTLLKRSNITDVVSKEN